MVIEEGDAGELDRALGDVERAEGRRLRRN